MIFDQIVLKQEKTKKILDIWVKGSTFPPEVLAQLAGILKGSQQGAYHYDSMYLFSAASRCNSIFFVIRGYESNRFIYGLFGSQCQVSKILLRLQLYRRRNQFKSHNPLYKLYTPLHPLTRERLPQ